MAYNGKYAKPSALVGVTLMRVAFVLLCLVIVSVYLMGGLLAKYHSTGSGDDQARVAKFDVNVRGTAPEGGIVCKPVANGDGTYTITIENKSEVAVSYTLSVEIENEPKYITPTFTNEEGDTAPEGKVAPGGTDVRILNFSVIWSAFTENKTGSSASEMLSFVVTADVAQID